MAEFAEGFRFNLADALAGYAEVEADLFESVFAAVIKAKAHPDDLFFAGREALEDFGGLLVEVQVDHVLGGRDVGLVDDEVSQVGFILFANGGFERHGFLRDAHDAANPVDGQFHAFCQFVVSRFATQLLDHHPRGSDQLVDGLDHMNRNANGAGLIGDGAADRLANPPGGVGGKLVAAAVFKLFDGLHEADVAFLDEVKELEATVVVALGDADDEAEIGFDELLASGIGLALEAHNEFESPAEFGGRRRVLGFQVLEVPCELFLLAAEVLVFGAEVAACGFEDSLVTCETLFERTEAVNRVAQFGDEGEDGRMLEPHAADEAGDGDCLPAEFPAQRLFWRRARGLGDGIIFLL